ncbi:spore germination protein [Gottfriedia acidiceleris]|uniref:spore germination protein n=1 Tax=Bacillaceae TaxID=186817 RepID=UPI000BEE2071|nr:MULTISPECIES: spore germination protein [unclassified Bacillus (in: firmicutes)]PEC50573.1 spore germination protein [Bacillus sp. AFS096315]PFM81894.1 spore germination protein [Bacillus sp. AFS077874]
MRTNTTTITSNKEEILSNNLKNNIEIIQEYLSHTEDLVVKIIHKNTQIFAVLFLESMIKIEALQSFIIEPILRETKDETDNIVKSYEIKNSTNISELGDSLLDGFCLILEENCSNGILAAASDDKERTISEPANEQNINGPRDGFVESINTNIQLLRKRIRNPELKVKYFTIGRITNTKVAMIYIDSIANRKLVEVIENRISVVEVDSLKSTGHLEELIEDNTFSPFPQVLNTERPDRAVSYLLDGKINLLVDGNPTVSVVPITFFAFYQSPDDYNHRWLIGSFFRIIRVFSFIIAICLPAIYIAIVSFHSEVLPIGILYSIRVSLEFVPFLPLAEAFMMQIILELLKEAAIRLPSPIAQTIGIVGGLVIGTAIVEAHLVSNTMIVVIGFTAIASFVAPVSEMGTSMRLLGFPTMIMASILGFFGITLSLMLIFMHMCKLKSFGMPYFSPMAPFRKEDIKDTFMRLPIWKQNTRPTDALPQKLDRQRISKVWKKK